MARVESLCMSFCVCGVTQKAVGACVKLKVKACICAFLLSATTSTYKKNAKTVTTGTPLPLHVPLMVMVHPAILVLTFIVYPETKPKLLASGLGYWLLSEPRGPIVPSRLDPCSFFLPFLRIL